MREITIGRTVSGDQVALPLRFANRHGLVTGVTGSGKTVTLQRLAEEFSRAGVPVFGADIKGDLSGIAAREIRLVSMSRPTNSPSPFGTSSASTACRSKPAFTKWETYFSHQCST